jgi:hypothetical protein
MGKKAAIFALELIGYTRIKKLSRDCRCSAMIAVVLAYRRSELTENLIRRILELDSCFWRKHKKEFISKIVIVHDGLRSGEGMRAKADHDETRFKLSAMRQNSDKIETTFYDNNVGLSRHTFRIINDMKLRVSECVFFEEDKAPTLKSFEFLFTNQHLVGELDLLDTMPFNSHLSAGCERLSTLFTDNGNTVVSDDLFGLAVELFESKKNFKTEFERNLYSYLSSFLTGFALTRAFRFYVRTLSWGLSNVDRPDALFAYALLLRKKLKNCPSEPLGEDWSDRDYRGKNVNKLPEGRGRICSSPTVKLWGFDLCPDCEKQGVSDRVGLTLRSTIRNSLEYRTRRIRQLI